MNKLRSISYYARREKLRAILANEMRRRKLDETSPQPVNENAITAAFDEASFVESGMPVALGSIHPARDFG